MAEKNIPHYTGKTSKGKSKVKNFSETLNENGIEDAVANLGNEVAKQVIKDIKDVLLAAGDDENPEEVLQAIENIIVGVEHEDEEQDEDEDENEDTEEKEPEKKKVKNQIDLNPKIKDENFREGIEALIKRSRAFTIDEGDIKGDKKSLVKPKNSGKSVQKKGGSLSNRSKIHSARVSEAVASIKKNILDK